MFRLFFLITTFVIFSICCIGCEDSSEVTIINSDIIFPDNTVIELTMPELIHNTNNGINYQGKLLSLKNQKVIQEPNGTEYKTYLDSSSIYLAVELLLSNLKYGDKGNFVLYVVDQKERTNFRTVFLNDYQHVKAYIVEVVDDVIIWVLDMEMFLNDIQNNFDFEKRIVSLIGEVKTINNNTIKLNTRGSNTVEIYIDSHGIKNNQKKFKNSYIVGNSYQFTFYVVSRQVLQQDEKEQNVTLIKTRIVEF